MKRLAVFLVALFSIATLCAQNVMPIRRGKLQTDLNGNTFAITNAGSINATTLTAQKFVGNGSGMTNLDGAKITGTLTNNTSGNAAIATNSPDGQPFGTAANSSTSAFDAAGLAAQRVSTNAGISFGQTLIGPTNVLAIEVKNSGTNYPFFATNNSYGNVAVLSNALSLATNIALAALANGGDSNVVVECNPFTWLFDYFDNGGAFGPVITLPTCVTFLGSGQGTVFTYTNQNHNDATFPILPQAGSFGNFAMNFYVCGQSLLQQNIHDITFQYPAWNAASGITNGCIDGVYGVNQRETNTYNNLICNGTYDAVNASASIPNGQMFLQFNNCYFNEQTFTNSQSLIVRDIVLFSTASNVTAVLNNCTLAVTESVTNSPYLMAGTTTNDAACIEFPVGCKGAKVYVLNSRFIVTSNNNTGWPINFGGIGGGNATGTNTVYVDNYSSSSLAIRNINWGNGGRSNAVVFMTPPGWTNYLQDGVWIHSP